MKKSSIEGLRAHQPITEFGKPFDCCVCTARSYVMAELKSAFSLRAMDR